MIDELPDLDGLTPEQLQAYRRALDRRIAALETMPTRIPAGIEPFREWLAQALAAYFSKHPDALEWRGTRTGLFRLAPAYPSVDYTRASIFLRYLEKADAICHQDTSIWNSQTWVFPRP